MTEEQIQAMLTMTPAQVLAVLQKIEGGIEAFQAFVAQVEASPMAPAIMAVIKEASPATASLIPVLKEISPFLPFLLNLIDSVESTLKPA